MDFKVTIAEYRSKTEQSATFEQYADALNYIDRYMAQWNNFNTGQTMIIRIQKVPSTTETLGVQTNEKIDIKAIFGRP